ncbi:MAG: Hsp20/alpha crystallin family protein [archaeon GB-1867-005]|nr:Hsp20/alpha crystallin family protein [Candidatus Culexmicrobium cathedralense]
MWKIFDEFEKMRRRLERLFEEFYEEFEKPMWDYQSKCLEPLVSVKEIEDKVVVTIDLPCVDKNNIKIYATEDTLTVEATLKEAYRFERLGVVRKETSFEYFKKVIRLPAPVIPEKAKARFKRGILEVVLPKKITGVEIKVE